MGYEKTVAEISKWDPVVTANRKVRVGLMDGWMEREREREREHFNLKTLFYKRERGWIGG